MLLWVPKSYSPKNRLIHVDISETEFPSLDGLRLRGTCAVPLGAEGGAVLVHGGGVTREEGGFFTRLALGLAEQGVASLRFDFRAHGASEGRQEDLTLAGIVHDVRAAVDHLTALTGISPLTLIGASFGGGVSAFFASRYPDRLRGLVLLNPLLNYKKRFIDDKPYWKDDYISEEAAHGLTEQGFVAHSPTFKLGRCLLNEVFYLRPHEALKDLTMPTLIVHGTRDTFIPVESSRKYASQIHAPVTLLEVEGAQHGFAVHDDPGYLEPQTQEWQAFVIRSVADWITRS